MLGLVIQDWRSIRVMHTESTTFVQPISEWRDFQGCEDLTWWLDVKSVQNPGTGATVAIEYQTSPSRDDATFKTMATVTLSTAGTQPTVTNFILDRNPTTPLARWFRYKLQATSVNATWGACFRLLATVTPSATIRA